MSIRRINDLRFRRDFMRKSLNQFKIVSCPFHWKYLILLLLLVNGITNRPLAQNEKKKNPLDLSFGVAIGNKSYWKRLSVFEYSSDGLPYISHTIQGQIFVQGEIGRNSFLKLRYSLLNEFELLFPLYDVAERTNEYALMPGWHYKTKWLYISAAAGFSINNGTYRKKFISSSGALLGSDNFEAQTYTVIGFPFETTAGIYWKEKKEKTEYCLTVMMIGNLNRSRFFGWNVGLWIKPPFRNKNKNR